MRKPRTFGICAGCERWTVLRPIPVRCVLRALYFDRQWRRWRCAPCRMALLCRSVLQ